MPSLIHNLDRDALLMLYLAGELPANDHAEVDAMLANDPAMRAQYKQMLAAQEVVARSLQADDAKLPLPTPVMSSVRRVGAAMDQWHIDQLNRKVQPVGRPTRKYGWVYSVAAVAAMILVTVFVLWSRVDDGKNDQIAKLLESVNKVEDESKNTNDAAANSDSNNTTIAETTDTAVGGAIENGAVESDGESLLATDPTDMQLSRVEVDLSTLSNLTDALRTPEDAVTP